MVHINIFCIGKVKEQFLRDAIAEYSKRLSKYCILNIIELPDMKIPDKLNSSIENQIIDFESNELISHFFKSDYKICLDLSGKQYSSSQFASKLSALQFASSEISFIIGGSLGVNDTLKELCNEKICFSKMTFPHQLIRIFLLEQIFRAFKINNNEKYHH